ncbi:hypothetical protein [Ancrocorticia populi]|uniref:hypothetical protein n=1 Tax=Ancrocorticia populi TaxID=2175228 RepID=UPI002709EFC4|nr:hypothetical protein [Ancrocorticia sp.]
MNKAVRPLSLALVAYSTLLVIVGWVAVGQTGFSREFIASIVLATVGLAVMYFGHWRRNVWYLGAGTATVLLLCPTPLGLWPMIIGIVLAVAFFWIAYQDSSGGKMTW